MIAVGILIGLAAGLLVFFVFGPGKRWLVRSGEQSLPPAVPRIDSLAPDFELSNLSGQKLRLSEQRGKIILINFWATWCGPCRHEIPDFNDVYSRYRDRGVEFLGIAVDESPETVLPEFLQDNPISYPILLGSPDLTFRYGVRGLPTTFIIDRAGRITKRTIGAMSTQTLETELDKLL